MTSLDGTSVYPSVSCVGMLDTTRYIPYRQLVGTSVWTGNTSHGLYVLVNYNKDPLVGYCNGYNLIW